MEIPFIKEDPLIERFPIHSKEEKKVEGNNAVTSRAHLVPHAEVYGALAPARGILVSLQGIPQDLIYGGQGTINEQHDCETLQMEGEGREEGQHHMMRSTQPYLFQRVNAKKRQIDLQCKGMDKVFHSYV